MTIDKRDVLKKLIRLLALLPSTSFSNSHLSLHSYHSIYCDSRCSLQQNKMSEIIRDDTFYHCTEKNVRGVLCRVTLSSSELLITETDSHKERKIIIEDIIGCLCMKNPEVNKNRSTNSDTDSVFICIYFYSLGKNFKNNLYRKRETALLRCCKYSSFVENCDLISKYSPTFLLSTLILFITSCLCSGGKIISNY